jgi:fucose permease
MKDSSYESGSDADGNHGEGTGTTTGRQSEEKNSNFAIPSSDNASANNILPNNDLNSNSNRFSSQNGTPEDAKTPNPAPQTPGPEASRTKLQTAIIMLCLCAALFLAALDITIVTTALPSICEYFDSDAGYTWIGSAYLLANAASTPSWGKFSDIWGRKSILLLSMAVFFLGSTLAATSVSIGMLIVARAVQGIGGGGIVVLVNICVSDLFSPRTRGKYLGMIGMVWAAASALGPLLGGSFAERVSWRWCFYINCEFPQPYPYSGLCRIIALLWVFEAN